MRRALIVALVLAAAASLTSAATCHSSQPDDLDQEKCEPWCTDKDHCAFCKCRACKRLNCPRCKSDQKEDISVEDCEDWCSHGDHCSYCKCRACEHLDCSAHPRASTNPITAGIIKRTNARI